MSVNSRVVLVSDCWGSCQGDIDKLTEKENRLDPHLAETGVTCISHDINPIPLFLYYATSHFSVECYSKQRVLNIYNIYVGYTRQRSVYICAIVYECVWMWILQTGKDDISRRGKRERVMYKSMWTC